LKCNVLAFISSKYEPTPWPNPKLTGKKATQYWFSTKSLPSIYNLHKYWYKKIDNKYIKILPSNIEELLTPISLADWIMDDGYFTEDSVKICTDNFTKDEVSKLINILNIKFDIKATVNKRINPNKKVMWRIIISILSMKKLILLVSPNFIPEMLYKLGIKSY